MNRNPGLPRGAIVLVADRRSEFGGKPRPAIVMQHSTLEALSSVTLCLLTSTPHAAAPLLRIAVAATAQTGLRAPSWAMIENLTTVRRNRVGKPIGRVEEGTMLAIGRALIPFLGLS